MNLFPLTSQFGWESNNFEHKTTTLPSQIVHRFRVHILKRCLCVSSLEGISVLQYLLPSQALVRRKTVIYHLNCFREGDSIYTCTESTYWSGKPQSRYQMGTVIHKEGLHLERNKPALYGTYCYCISRLRKKPSYFTSTTVEFISRMNTSQKLF